VVDRALPYLCKSGGEAQNSVNVAAHSEVYTFEFIRDQTRHYDAVTTWSLNSGTVWEATYTPSPSCYASENNSGPLRVHTNTSGSTWIIGSEKTSIANVEAGTYGDWWWSSGTLYLKAGADPDTYTGVHAGGLFEGYTATTGPYTFERKLLLGPGEHMMITNCYVDVSNFHWGRIITSNVGFLAYRHLTGQLFMYHSEEETDYRYAVGSHGASYQPLKNGLVSNITGDDPSDVNFYSFDFVACFAPESSGIDTHQSGCYGAAEFQAIDYTNSMHARPPTQKAIDLRGMKYLRLGFPEGLSVDQTDSIYSCDSLRLICQ